MKIFVSPSSMTDISGDLGRVGFDQITLSNIWQHFPFSAPLLDNFSPAVQSCLTGYADEQHKASVRKNKIVIHGSDYDCAFGFQGQREFSKITIHASQKQQPNLRNITLDEAKDKFHAALKDIKTFFRMDILTDESQILITSAEINRTFILNFPFSKYSRILHILSESQTGFGYKQQEVTDIDSSALETLYLLGQKTKLVKIYLKSKELEQKYGVESETELVRCEITTRGQNLSGYSSVSDDSQRKTCHLIGITHAEIESYYTACMKYLFAQMDKRIQISQNAESANNPMSLVCSLAVQSALRGDPYSFCESILNQCYIDEVQRHQIRIFDIADLKKIVQDSFLKPDEIKSLFCRTIDEMTARPEAYSDRTTTYIHQNQMYQELKNKLYASPSRYHYSLRYHSDQENKLMNQKNIFIWWDNPAHQEINVQDEQVILNEIYRITNLQFAHAYKTEHQKPLTYLKDNENRVAILKDDFLDRIKPLLSDHKQAERNNSISNESPTYYDFTDYDWTN